MKKKCPNCGRTFEEQEYKLCPICGDQLIDIEDRPLSKGDKIKVFERDGFRCQWCGASKKNGAELTVDHIIPKAAGIVNGGTNDMNNLQTLCKDCNENKADIIFENKLRYGIRVTQIKIKSLEDAIERNKKILNTIDNEDEKFRILAEIKKIEEIEMPALQTELSKLLLEFEKEEETNRNEQDEKERKENLFNRLYVTLNDNDVDFLVSYFSLTRKPLDKLIKQIIDKYSDNEIAEALLKKERYGNLTLDYSQEKVFIKYFSLDNYSTNDLKLYLVKNGYSQEDMSKLTDKAKNKIFSDLNDNLTKNQHFLMCYKFNNSKNKTLNFFIYHDFSIDKFKQELNLTKYELSNEISNFTTNADLKILKRHFSLDNSSDEELIDYLIDNEYINKKDIQNLIDLEKDEVYNQFFKKLDDKQLFYAKIKFKNFKEELIAYLIDNDFSYEKLLSDLNLIKTGICHELSNSLTIKDKSLLKHYLKIYYWSEENLIDFLIDHNYSIKDVQKILKTSKIKFDEELNKTLNHASTELLIDKYGLNKEFTKNDLINFLLTNEIIIPQILDDINFVKKDMLKGFDEKLDYKQISYMRYKALKYQYDNLYAYLTFNNNIDRIINTGKEEFELEIYQTIDYQQVYTISRKLNVPNSKKGLSKYLIEHYSVEEIRDMLK